MADTSFLPQDYIERRIQRRTNILSLTLFVIVMSGVVGAYIVTDQQRQKVEAEQAEVANEFTRAASQLDELDRLNRQKHVMLRKSRVTGALVERFPRTTLLAELINRMPTTVSLISFDLETKTVKRTRTLTKLERAKQKQRAQQKNAKNGTEDIPEPPETEVSVQLIGLAPTDADVADFMAGLSQCPMFQNLNLAYSEEVTVEEQPMRKFRVEMTLDQALDMEAYEPQRVARHPKQNPWSRQVRFDDEGQMVMPDGETTEGD